MAKRIEDKILDILNRPDLNEAVEYEIVGGPSPSEVQKGPLDYAKSVTQAKVPTAPGSSDGTKDIPGVGEFGSDEADENDPITDVVDNMDEDEDKDDEDKDDIEETFASLLARLAEEDEDEDDKDKDDLDEDEESLKGDNGGTPDETLPDVDSDLDSPDELVTKAPGAKVAESEDDEDDKDDLDEDEGSAQPKETLIGDDIDSMTDEPDKLVTKAPGAKVAESEDDEDDDDKKEDVTEDIEAIFRGSKLSEAAKTKAATIFKAAVTRRVNEEKHRVQKVATKKLKEAFGVLKTRFSKKQNVFESKMSGQVDQYLNYVVENWMKENRLAVERGIRAELAEDFIKGLKNLFVEHYIEVPESKVDVVATLGKKVTKLESKLNETVETNVKMRSALNAYRKDEVIRSVSSGLADTQREKLRGLAEGVEYTTRKEFSDKLANLKESYFPKAGKPKKEEPLMEAATKKPTSSEMETYTKTLSKFKKN
jgi:hypothetical protein